MTHVDFDGWQFISNKDAAGNHVNIDREYARADKSKPIVVFGSFQDLLGTNESGGIKAKNEFIHTDNWDLVIFDEYHFGAWRENAKKLFENPDDEEAADFDAEKYQLEEAGNAYNETFLPITTGHYLFLSGTPFRAINSGEFIEDQIYNWTYSDEQRAKEEWKGSNNPYAALPRMVMLTYRIPDSIRQIAMQGEFNEFDLNVFFSAKGKGDEARFVYENEVQKWLDLIRGSYLPSNIDDMKLGQDKRPPMPYSDTRLLNVLSHTLWFLPNVASCQAMYNLMMQKQNAWFNQRYEIIVCAGSKAGIGLDALTPVRNAMGDPLKTQTITLSCGKLTTGVTVKPWTGVFMLRNLKSPETYFQTAFRVQSPWTITDEHGNQQIMKQECYVFDFALDRALRQISDYSCRLDVNEANPEKKVAEFINFLPVLAYDGSTMRQISAQDVLDIAMAGTSATLLAKRWESALLVNVDNETLARLMSSKEAMDALMSIEGFRSLNQDIQTIINKSEAVKKAKKEGGEKTPKEKKELSDEEKEYKSMRKKIQEKLIKFATRVPVFMYLTDYRERSLKDVITQLEPGLFKKVTGLDVKDFELLCSLGVFNANLMNDAIFKFKRYEDSSLTYTGIDKHEGKDIGGWDTVENHLNTIKNLKTLDEYKEFILSRVNERLTNDYFDITLVGSEGLAVSGRGNNAWNAYVASLNIMNAKILFSKSNLLVSKLFEPGTDGNRKSLEKHHLFPKAYLKSQGYSDAKINQMANYAFIDWKDNMDILDDAPSVYYPIVCAGLSDEQIRVMEEENALPHGWENMAYEDFLIERRKLMAAKIKAAFEILKKAAT